MPSIDDLTSAAAPFVVKPSPEQEAISIGAGKVWVDLRFTERDKGMPLSDYKSSVLEPVVAVLNRHLHANG